MEVITKVLVAIGVVFFIGLFTALPVMWLWNWLMPLIFGLITINFWQALGLSLLCGFLSGGSSSSKK
jgi:hypothetical protein